MEDIPCKNCICIPICINEVKAEYDDSTVYNTYCHSYNFKFDDSVLLGKCSLISAYSYCCEENREFIKKFYLQKKGLIIEIE